MPALIDEVHRRGVTDAAAGAGNEHGLVRGLVIGRHDRYPCPVDALEIRRAGPLRQGSGAGRFGPRAEAPWRSARGAMIRHFRRLLGFRLVRNVAALYGVRAVDQLLPIVVIPFLARVLGADGWGLVAGAQALAMYGIITVEYGFEFAGTRAVARDRDDPGRLAELISGIFATQLLLAGAIALAAVVVRWTVPEFQQTPGLDLGRAGVRRAARLLPLVVLRRAGAHPGDRADRGQRQGDRDRSSSSASCAARRMAGSCSPPMAARPASPRWRATRWCCARSGRAGRTSA